MLLATDRILHVAGQSLGQRNQAEKLNGCLVYVLRVELSSGTARSSVGALARRLPSIEGRMSLISLVGYPNECCTIVT